MSAELYWDDAKVGDECVSPSVTVTEAMVNAYAELTGDFTPVHVDDCRNTIFTVGFGDRGQRPRLPQCQVANVIPQPVPAGVR